MNEPQPANEVERFLAAWFAVRQFIQASNFNRFQGAGLSATQFMTLNLVPEQGFAIGELARRMNLKPATVAKTVDSLEARGMIERARGADDRRTVIVQITEAGKALVNNANGQFRQQMGDLFAAMAEQDRAGLVAGLESLVAQISPAGKASSEAATRAGVPRETRKTGQSHRA